jgi:hypothetical protein
MVLFTKNKETKQTLRQAGESILEFKVLIKRTECFLMENRGVAELKHVGLLIICRLS